MRYLASILALVFLTPSFVLAQDQDALRIGAIISLTGPAAEYGQAIKNGLELSVQESAAQERKFQLIIEDAQYSASAAVTAFQKLVEVDHVSIVYAWGVLFCDVLAPLAEARHVAFVGQCINEGLTKDRRYVVQFMDPARNYAAVVTAFALRQNWRRLGVVLTENSYLTTMFQALERASNGELELVVVDRFAVQDSDFRSAITKLRRADVDAVGVFLFSGQIATFYQQAAQQGYYPPTVGTNFFDSISELALARGAMDGAVFANNVVAPEFIARYESIFHTVSQVQWAALSYEFVQHLSWSFSGAPIPDTPAMLRQLREIQPRPSGAVGAYRFVHDASGDHFAFDLAMKQVDAGATRFLDDSEITVQRRAR